MTGDLVTFLDAVLYNSTGLLFVVFGVFLLVRATGFPDMTVDGSFTIGAAIYSASMVAGIGTPLALAAAVLGGTVGGCLTWAINTRLGVGKVVSGVLSMIVLILLAPYVSGGSTKSLLRVSSVYDHVDALDRAISIRIVDGTSYQLHLVFSVVWLLIFSAFTLSLLHVLNSRSGLRLRYIGSAAVPVLVDVPERLRRVLAGLAFGNGAIALGAAIEAQRRGGFTANMGVGTILVGLAVLVLGESLMKSRLRRAYLSLKEEVIGLILGTLLYSLGVQVVLALRISVVDIRLLTALFLLIMLAVAGRFHSRSAELF